MLVVKGGSDLFFSRGASSARASAMRQTKPEWPKAWHSTQVPFASSNDKPATRVPESLRAAGRKRPRPTVASAYQSGSASTVGWSGKPPLSAWSDWAVPPSRACQTCFAAHRRYGDPLRSRCAVAPSVLKISWGWARNPRAPLSRTPRLNPFGETNSTSIVGFGFLFFCSSLSVYVVQQYIFNWLPPTRITKSNMFACVYND
ncbi:hypothetical protein DFH09DRAFT_1269814 [Mycena vulgaris]|nr:hypothetical protein DFH09DRAFT_1269814 [Mycena vulgaris]